MKKPVSVMNIRGKEKQTSETHHIVVRTRGALVSGPNDALVAVITSSTMNCILQSLVVALLDDRWKHLVEVMVQGMVILGVFLCNARMAKVKVGAVRTLVAEATDVVAAVVATDAGMRKASSDRCGLGFWSRSLAAGCLPLGLSGVHGLRRRLR